MTNFWEVNIGNILTIISLALAYYFDRKLDRRKEQEKHEANLLALSHLDACVDALKNKVDMIWEFVAK